MYLYNKIGFNLKAAPSDQKLTISNVVVVVLTVWFSNIYESTKYLLLNMLHLYGDLFLFLLNSRRDF